MGKSAIKEHGKKVLDSLNLHWRFCLGECSFRHHDFEAGADALPRGVATVGAVDWDTLEKKFGDMEQQIISAKMAVMEAEQDKDELKGQIKVLTDTVQESMRQVEERSADFVMVNQKL